MLGLMQVKIQRGTTSGSGNVTIEEVASINKCLIFGSYGGTTAFAVKMLDTKTIQVGGACEWQVIEFGGAV